MRPIEEVTSAGKFHHVKMGCHISNRCHHRGNPRILGHRRDSSSDRESAVLHLHSVLPADAPFGAVCG